MERRLVCYIAEIFGTYVCVTSLLLPQWGCN